MQTRPALADERITTALRSDYGLDVVHLHFLPLGNDINSYVYRVDLRDGGAVFVKIKHRLDNPASLRVPRYLRDLGITEVVAPVATHDGSTHALADGFAVIVYPFVAGGNGMDNPMTDAHWIAYGAVLRRIHDATASRPSEINALLRCEAYDLPIGADLRLLQHCMRAHLTRDDIERDTLTFWRAHDTEIETLITRAEALGRNLRNNPAPLVLCHSDIHTANLMVHGEREVHVVDWDSPLLAPRERDLMFVAGMLGTPGDWIAPAHEALFFEGYGACALNWRLLAYYRYERALEDLADYGNRLLSVAFDDATRRDAATGFQQVFAPGEAVDWARACDARAAATT
jgi:spectinomycin phosphotransferase